MGSPPVVPENCTNGVDDDCDGEVDYDDFDCRSDFLSAYAGVANAEAASYGSTSLTGSGTFNALTLLIVPMAAVFFLRVLHRINLCQSQGSFPQPELIDANLKPVPN